MDKQYHLLACISTHGFGHAAQTAPILNALYARMPNLRITVRSKVPLAYLRSRIHVPFGCVRENSDIGMRMASALDVDVTETAAAYHSIHLDWGGRVMREARNLRELSPDFVLSDVGYLPLAGAHQAGIPCAAMSSLNWVDIFKHYCGSISGMHRISAQMLAAYNSADAFLCLTPSMPMNEIYHHYVIGPVAAVGQDRRIEINNSLDIRSDHKLVLVSLGGIASHLSMVHWPRVPGVKWLVPASWHSTHPDAHVLESLNMTFIDVLASVDALVCKPGYGSFVEAACNGKPVLFARRNDWPETSALKHWLGTHGVCREVDRAALESGKFTEVLSETLSLPKPRPVIPKGIVEAASWLEQRMRLA